MVVQRYFTDFTNVDQYSGVSMRIRHWNGSMLVIKEHPLWGVGTGDAQDELNIAYCRLGYEGIVNFNSHNQYLFDALSMGVPGIAALVTMLGFAFYRAWTSGNKLWIWLLLLIAISCTTECVLASNKGLVFFTFFVSLFSFAKNNKANSEQPRENQQV
jgi:O-antigen ligase